MRIAAWILLVFLLLPQGSAPQDRIALCDLLGSPEKYNGKVVTVRGTYITEFERSEIHCLDCLPLKGWLEFSEHMDKASEKSWKRIPKEGGIVNLTVQGVFESGSSYGHLNGYQFQLTAQKISDVVVVQKGVKSHEEQEDADKKWGCGGTNPK